MSLFVLILTLTAVLAMTTSARDLDGKMTSRSERAKAQKYAFTPEMAEAQDGSVVPTKGPSQMSLGSDADGGSPGYIFGSSHEERQGWYNGKNRVAFSHTPNLHFLIENKPFQGDGSSRWLEYWMYDLFELGEGSPCIDKGNNEAPMLPKIDRNGLPRVMNGKVDMGAHERYYSPGDKYKIYLPITVR